MRRIIILSIFLFISNYSFSGINDTLEFIVDRAFTSYYKLNDGLIIVYDEGKKPNKTKVIEHYDTNFNLIKKIDFNLESDCEGQRPTKNYKTGNNFYLLYFDYKKKRVQIVNYNVLTNNIIVSPPCQLDKRETIELAIFGDYAYITFHTVGIMHYKANLIVFNIKTGETRNIDLPSETRTQLPIKNIFLDEDLNEINIIFQSSLEEDSELEIIRFDSLGNRIQPRFYLEEPKNNYFPKPNMLKVDKNKFFITGLSTIKAQKGDPIITNFARSREEQFFISFYESSKMQWIKYFDFRNVKSVKSFYNDEYKMQFKKQFIKGDKIYFIAEAYFPTYTWIKVYDTKTGKYDKDKEVIDYYEYTHCFILCFDKNNGELAWDVSFPSYVKTKNLKNVIRNIDFQGEFFVVVEDNNVIKKIRIDDNGKTSSENLTDLSKKNINANDGFILQYYENWYSNYFIEISITHNKKKGIKDVIRFRKF